MVNNPPAMPGDIMGWNSGSIPESGRSPREGPGTSVVFLPGESHGQRSLAVYSL